jgi:alkaline phosphatase
MMNKKQSNFIDRRTFFKVSISAAGFFACCPFNLSALSAAENAGKIRFGLVTDPHFGRIDSNGSRYYVQSIDKLNDAIRVFNENKVDFVIELGDFKDMAKDNIPKTLAFLDEIEQTYRQFRGDVYHVLGNHDMDCLSKTEFLEHTKNSGKANGKTCYSFVKKGIKFIALDANYNEDGSDYDRGNFNWTNAYIPESEKRWLENELTCKQPVVLFIHQLLDDFSDVPKSVCINNAADIVAIIERKNNVLAVFQGHHHVGHYSFRNGTHYFTLKGMIEGSYPENNSFAIVEIEKSLNINLDGFKNCEDKFMERK